MNVELRYFAGCPNWEVAHGRLQEALRAAGLDAVEVRRTRVETSEEAVALGFVGSPTVLIDGHDSFADGDELVGLACRVFHTPHGLAGSPTLEQLYEALS
jgi:hypothetical protein